MKNSDLVSVIVLLVILGAVMVFMELHPVKKNETHQRRTDVHAVMARPE